MACGLAHGVVSRVFRKTGRLYASLGLEALLRDLRKLFMDRAVVGQLTPGRASYPIS